MQKKPGDGGPCPWAAPRISSDSVLQKTTVRHSRALCQRSGKGQRLHAPTR